MNTVMLFILCIFLIPVPASAEDLDCLLETPGEVAVRFHEAMGVQDFETAFACLHPEYHRELVEWLTPEPTPETRDRAKALAVLLGAADFEELRKWEPEKIMAAWTRVQAAMGPPVDEQLMEVQYEVLDQKTVSDTEVTVILRLVIPRLNLENYIEVPLKKTAAGCWRLTEMGHFFR